jgi:hypothetical protein
MLTRVAQDTERALRPIEQTDGLLEDDKVAATHGLLREPSAGTSTSTMKASRGFIAAPARSG